LAGWDLDWFPQPATGWAVVIRLFCIIIVIIIIIIIITSTFIHPQLRKEGQVPPFSTSHRSFRSVQLLFHRRRLFHSIQSIASSHISLARFHLFSL
jgi:hypothetical protein